MARRFNIGDRVVRFNPSCYNNLFHMEKYLDYAQVTDANDDRFTTSGKLTSIDNGRNYNECFQSSGKLVYGYYTDNTFWFNLDTEKELIDEFHKKTEEQFLLEVKKTNDEEIERIEAQIKSLEKAKARLQDMTDAYFFAEVFAINCGVACANDKTFEHIREMNNILQKKINQCNKIYKK